MLRIYLARHGQDRDNEASLLNGRRNEPLTELGQKQAAELAEKIKELNIKLEKVYTSPLQRTYTTAKVVTEALGLGEPEKLDLLIEREFGVMTGQPHSKILEMCMPEVLHTEKVNYFLSPDGAETFPDLIDRAKMLLDEVKARHSDGNILMVTHGDFGKMIYCAYYGLDWKDVLRLFHFGNSDLILLSPDSAPEDVHVVKIQQAREHEKG